MFTKYLSPFLVFTLCHSLSISSKNTGYFWQVTDFHYDANYSTTGDPSHMCHQSGTPSPHIGNYGNYLCDAPWKLVTSAIQAMYRFQPDPDFIMWTGDSVPHVEDSDLSLSKIYTIIGNVTEELRAVFPNTSIYPVLGNHDPYPANQMGFNADSGQYYRDILSISGWSELLDPDQQANFLQGGYYSVQPSAKLRLLGLNTNLYYDQDKLTRGIPDPAGQFRFIEQQLQQASTQQQAVMIFSHIAPGMFELGDGIMWLYRDFNRRYLDILQKYSGIIQAQMYGHEHTDSFRILFNKEAKPVGSLYLSPAVTPWKSTLPGVGANNPSVRLYTYDRDNGVIQNYRQYYLNLTAANINNNPDHWRLEYDTSVVYGLDTLKPDQLHSLVKAFKRQGNHLFKRYLDYNSVKYMTDVVCNETCFSRHVCAITQLGREDYRSCMSGHMTTVPPVTISTPAPGIPHYMYYVIGGLAGVVLLLFFIVAFLFINRRRKLVPPRYSKFGSLSVNK